MDIYLTQGLHRAVQQRPQATATICGERRQDWRTLEGRVARLAAVLHAHGLQAGERVAGLRALLHLGDGQAPAGMARTEDAMARATPLADTLPLSPTGKVLKNRLRARAAACCAIQESSP